MSTDPVHFKHCHIHEGYLCTCGAQQRHQDEQSKPRPENAADDK
ncbi:hypothetical protein ABZ442_05050 [Streptomyces triculaminicus]